MTRELPAEDTLTVDDEFLLDVLFAIFGSFRYFIALGKPFPVDQEIVRSAGNDFVNFVTAQKPRCAVYLPDMDNTRST